MSGFARAQSAQLLLPAPVCSEFLASKGELLAPGSEAELVQLRRMERCMQVITWSRLCHMVPAQADLILQRFIEKEIRFARPAQIDPLKSAMLQGEDEAMATKWPGGALPCDAVRREITGLAIAVGVTPQDLHEATQTK